MLVDISRKRRTIFRSVRNNCGTGAGGFQPGNTCAKGGVSGEAEWAKGGMVFHATSKGSAKSLEGGISEDQLNQRDSGFFGAGFYTSREPQNFYGKSLVAIRLADNAKILDVGELKPSSPKPWHAEFKASMERRILARRPDISPERLKEITDEVTPGSKTFSHISYSQEVRSFARAEGYQGAAFAGGQETVIWDKAAVASIKHVGGLKAAEKERAEHKRLTGNALVVNPFVSEAQRRWMHANEPAMAKKWARHALKKKLPRQVRNARKARARKIDPSRTTMIRKKFMSQVGAGFRRLAGALVALVAKEDAFGLAQVANVFCPTGPGGGVDPTCSPGGTGGGGEGPKSAVAREILSRAKQVEFSDVTDTGGGMRIDYDDIEAKLTREESQELEEHLERLRDRASERIEPEPVDADEVAKDAGFEQQDINEALEELIQRHGGDQTDDLMKAADNWYQYTSSHGREAVDEVSSWLLSQEGVPDDLKKEWNDYADSVHEAIDKEMKRAEEKALEQAYESFMNYDDTDDRHEWLRNFYDENKDRFTAQDTSSAWRKTRAGDSIYRFSAANGQTYEIAATKGKITVGENRLDKIDISFSDSSGSYGVEGHGGAAEVFGKVTAAVTALAMRDDPSVLTFSAAEKSRRKLYDRLVKTVAKVLPEYAAAFTEEGSDSDRYRARQYMVFKRDYKNAVLERAEKIKQDNPLIRVEMLVNAASVVTLLEADISPSWFPTEWVANVFCPTGPGGGVDPTCSPGESMGLISEAALRAAHPFVGSFSELGDVEDPDAFSPLQSLTSEEWDKWDEYQKGWVNKGQIVKLMLQNEDFQADLQTKLETMFPSGYAVIWRGGSVEGDKVSGGSLDRTTALSFASGHTGSEEVAKGRLFAYKVPISKIVGIGNIVERELFFKTKGAEIVGNAFDPDQPRDEAGRWTHLTTNTGRYSFSSSPEKVAAFKRWLAQQLAAEVSGANQQRLWEAFVQRGYERGAGRAFEDWRRTQPAAAEERLDFYRGSRESFLKSSFAQKESVDKVKLLAGRAFNDLDGVTSAMSTKLVRYLTVGLTEGKHPNAIAREMAAEVGIARSRAETIARTEIMRAHAEGQLDAFEKLGVEEVGVMVEWVTAAGIGATEEEMEAAGVCPLCQEMSGVVLRISEARGMLPRHPRCRCIHTPANVGEDKGGQVRGRGAVTAAIRESQKAGGQGVEDWGPGKEISRDRPKEIVGNELVEAEAALLALANAFCPTGPGGGQDNSCPPSNKGGGETPTTSAKLGPRTAPAVVASYERFRKDQNIPDAIIHRAEQIAKDIASQGVWIAASPAVLGKVLSEGRFKTQHETGTSGGFLSPELRQKFEESYFGDRPVYGFMSEDGQSGWGTTRYPDRGEKYVGDDVHQYGTARIKLKDSVRERTSFTSDDSFDFNRSGVAMAAKGEYDPDYSVKFLPAMVDKPTARAILPHKEETREIVMGTLGGFGYSEAQIFGDVKVSDIDRVVFYHKDPPKVLQGKLKKAGIAWERRDYAVKAK